MTDSEEMHMICEDNKFVFDSPAPSKFNIEDSDLTGEIELMKESGPVTKSEG